MNALTQLISVTLLAMVLTGCGGSPVKPSGFLASYDGFKEREWSDGAQVYLKEGHSLESLGKYRKIMLLPPEIWYGEGAGYKGINPDELKYVTDKFVSTFKATFEPEYPLVDEAGPDVLLIRSAITGIDRMKPERSALGYIPIALLVSTAKKAVVSAQGEEVIIYSASLEAEVFDSVSGDRLAALIDQRASEKQRLEKGTGNIQMVDEVIDYWVARFKRNWDRAHGK